MRADIRVPPAHTRARMKRYGLCARIRPQRGLTAARPASAETEPMSLVDAMSPVDDAFAAWQAGAPNDQIAAKMFNAAVCVEARQHQGVQRMVGEAGGADAAAEGWLTSNRSALGAQA
jgi:hypothetical protein